MAMYWEYKNWEMGVQEPFSWSLYLASCDHVKEYCSHLLFYKQSELIIFVII